LQVGGFRFHFFSHEESRPHIHVQFGGGEAKIWLEPTIEIADSSGLTVVQLRRALRIVEEHQREIRKAWQKHFGG
jgi:hypothetical protein